MAPPADEGDGSGSYGADVHLGITLGPRHVRWTDALPLNPSGKVQRFVLRDDAVAALTGPSDDAATAAPRPAAPGAAP